MDCDGDLSGPITRSRAKGKRLVDQNTENSRRSRFAIPFEGQGTTGNQNNIGTKRKRARLVKQENETLVCEPETTSETNLLTVLDDQVCRNHLLSFLQVGDLLRLRRVCKFAKETSQTFIRTMEVSTQKPVKINFQYKTSLSNFDRFQKVSNRLPTRKTLHVTISDKGTIQKAPKMCTNNITNLIIVNLDLPSTKKSILNFLESFSNVTHLVLDQFKCRCEQTAQPTIKILETFKNLKSLKLLNCHIVWPQGWTTDTFTFIQKMVKTNISHLEHISLPFHQFVRGYPQWRDDVVALACLCIFSETNIKIEGVTGQLITELLRTEGRTPEMRGRDEMIRNISAKIVSIDRADREVFLQKLTNLEKINFELCGSFRTPLSELGFCRRDWSKLKEIRVQFQNGSASLGQFWDFLFVDIVRKNVVELHISFHGFNREEHIYPKTTSDILTSCPNLKILYIKSLYSQPFDLPQLWRGLPRLEELHFGGCADDTDFIGMDSANPALLELKNLKVLEFADMNWMDVTDDLFSKVVCQMQLKELHLSCVEYGKDVVKSVTLNGIMSLLSGKFASTVERLSMKRLRMKDVTKEELKSIGNRFRSAKMY